ncbi:MAG: monovalent cation/H+ antiporter subunit D family protein [Longimicrobiales bacterium]
MSEHFPVLLVLVPLLIAPLCIFSRSARAAWAFSVLACVSSLFMVHQVWTQVLASGPISYFIGDWAPPVGIEYRVDAANAWVLLIVAIIGAVVAVFARASVEREVEANRIPLFYAAFLLCFCGLLGIAITGDLFNVFVFLEISSLSAYGLISLGQDKRALTSAFRYLIMGSVGATFIVIGIGLIYVMTGSLNMADLSQLLPTVWDTRTIKVAYGFLAVGTFLKLALFPLHLWLPNAYTFAPSAVTAFIASTATKVAVYMLLRFFFTVFGPAFSFDIMRLDMVLLPLALVSIVTMSLVAIFQVNVKRLLAYSSVAQIGYMILGVSFASVTGLTATLLHLFNHAMIKGSLFMAMGCVMYRIGSVHIDAMAGLGRRMPYTMAAFVVGGLSLVGVPMTVGFISKWYLILGALERGWWPVAVLVLITSVMALVYVWRVVEAAYFQEFPHEEDTDEAPLSLLIPTWALVLANLYFGINAQTTIGAAEQAAQTLMGTLP